MVPLLGAIWLGVIAGCDGRVPLLGAIHCCVPLLGAMVGRHWWGAMVGCNGRLPWSGGCHGHCWVPVPSGRHCWMPCGRVPLLDAIDGCHLVGIAGCHVVGCHCWMPLLCAAGCHGRVPFISVGCHGRVQW